VSTQRVAVVTGGGTGIGRATALLLAERGHALAICGRRAEPLARVRADIEAAGGRCLATPCDVRELEQVESFVSEVLAAYSRIDVVVNNAGGQFVAPAEEIPPKGFRAVHRLAVDGAWNVTHTIATRALIPQRSGVVLFVGVSPRRGMPTFAHAASARAALENLASGLALEWSRFGIRTVCVSVGTVASEGLEQYDPDDVADWVRTIPMQRLGTPREVAEVMAFLASDAAGYVTGTVVTVDGGADAWGVGGYPSQLEPP
jgi:citronellol/citronellal dehydrogenase